MQVRSRTTAIVFAMITVIFTGTAFAGYPIDGRAYVDEDEIIETLYRRSDNYISTSVSDELRKSMNIDPVSGRFLFISPDKDYLRRNFQAWGWLKATKKQQIMIATHMKIQTELVWHYFEKMGLVEIFDVTDSNYDENNLIENYDYVVRLNCINCIESRKPKDVDKTIIVVEIINVDNGQVRELSRTIGAPFSSLSSTNANAFPGIAVKFAKTMEQFQSENTLSKNVKSINRNSAKLKNKIQLGEFVSECFYENGISLRILGYRECPNI